ncbi:helix-turn-helix domain-containing protein [Pelagerythrobacter aerophilus]|uniref:Chromosomal replication initiator DnaA C-terminal domain-containing protein n=1 Tax=Pelagerythrobacter aerophilus TaxID=2306995 RepID=A0A418NJS6_9SPHN|nr:helix-turn-helix domain-containing protein [Pelagerythrobacter aerophilus]RIV79553.1 hypothetical protein D2V04_06165 [Pelagerythrobacter aerophilus]
MKPLRSKLLRYLRELARAGQPCPLNRDLAAHLGASADGISEALTQLRDLNRIAIERVGNRRIVTLLGEGIATADPRPAPEPIVVRPRVREIIDTASRIFDVPAKDIASASRLRMHSTPRQVVCYVASQRGWRSTEIGRVLQRDHSTVLYGLDRVRARRAADAEFAAKVAELLERSPVRVVAG